MKETIRLGNLLFVEEFAALEWDLLATDRKLFNQSHQANKRGELRV